MNEGALAANFSVAFFLLILWYMTNLWTNSEAVKRAKKERGWTARRRKQFVLQADPEIRQKELEIEETLENLATCSIPPALKLLKEFELNKKMLELQLWPLPSERKNEDSSMMK